MVSILIPCYNSEDYIRKCLQSIQRQTYKEWEVIIIDDGSIDSTAQICKEFEKSDNRIKLYRIENQGVANARNLALSKATGEYVTFVDSDDVISEYYIESLLNLLIENNADISVCNYIEQKGQNDITTMNNEENNMILQYTNIQAMEALFFKDNLRHSPWGKLYKRKLFENIKYPNLRAFEDLTITYKLIYKAKKVVFTNKILYGYNIRDGSLMHSQSNNIDTSILEISEKIRQDLKEYPEKELKNAGEYLICMHAISIIDELPINKKTKREFKKCFSIIKENRKRLLIDKRVKLTFKILLISSFFGKYAIKLIYKIKHKLRKYKLNKGTSKKYK